MKYRVVMGRVTTNLVIRKSEFITSVAPVSNEEAAWSFIAEIKEATHNVWAFRIGQDEYMRFSDDGEPSGTAGRPILEVIQREGIHDVAIVVTRYFGGILLGAGGLVRAYSQSATQGLKAAPKGFLAQREKLKVKIDYPSLGKLENELAILGGAIDHAEYGVQVLLEILIPPEHYNYLQQIILDLTNGDAQITQLDPVWIRVAKKRGE